MIEQYKVKPGRKFDQVRDGARGIFLRDGFSGASVDDIARASKVSKATLYSYFPEKVMMFHEVMRHEMEKLTLDGPIKIDDSAPASEGLPLMTLQIARWLTSVPAVEMHRVGIAEATRFPEMASRYQATLNAVIGNVVKAHLDRWVAKGQMSIADTMLAADQLIRLSGALVQDRALLGGETDPDDSAIRHAADSAARLFMAAHGTAGTEDLPLAATG